MRNGEVIKGEGVGGKGLPKAVAAKGDVEDTVSARVIGGKTPQTLHVLSSGRIEAKQSQQLKSTSGSRLATETASVL